VPAAATSGTNLSWGDCGSSGQVQESFACDTNSGTSVLYVSVVPHAALPQMNGAACKLYLQTDQATLSPWWHLEENGCRGPTTPDGTDGGLVTNFDFTGETGCLDPWDGSAAGGMFYQPATAGNITGPNRALIRTACAIPGSTPMNGGVEYYLTKLLFRHAASVGIGACEGCGENACILLSQVNLYQAGTIEDDYYSDSQSASRNWVLWHTGVVTGGCPAALPVRKTTWGAVKSLYR
jgi:hypothetical protein